MGDKTQTLSDIELFDSLSEAEREAIGRLCRWHRYVEDRYIIGHEDETSEVFFIIEGRVRVTLFSRSGKEVSFADLSAGKCFGEMAAIDGSPRSATVIALSDTLLASMPATAFLKVVREHPDVSMKLLQYFAGLVRGLSDRVFQFSVMAVKNRIHAELLRLARQVDPDADSATIKPAPTHAEIASRVSTHREAVTRELNALNRQGVVERRQGALVIRDIERLADLVETGLDD